MSHREPHAATRAPQGLGMGMRGCEHAGECSSERPGHRLHGMQSRLAAIAASKWVDAIVLDVDEAGFATLADLDGETHRVWHHSPLGELLTAGEPVALHSVYGVLVAAGGRFSVATA